MMHGTINIKSVTHYKHEQQFTASNKTHAHTWEAELSKASASFLLPELPPAATIRAVFAARELNCCSCCALSLKFCSLPGVPTRANTQFSIRTSRLHAINKTSHSKPVATSLNIIKVSINKREQNFSTCFYILNHLFVIYTTEFGKSQWKHTTN